jgi:threonine dehydrogenase-like Zn-dependent dehydrogenase
VEASGDPRAAELAPFQCRDGGVIALVGSYHPDGHISCHYVTQHNLRIEGINAGHGGWSSAVHHLAVGDIPPGMLQPKVVDINDAPATILAMLDAEPRPVKLILQYPGPFNSPGFNSPGQPTI